MLIKYDDIKIKKVKIPIVYLPIRKIQRGTINSVVIILKKFENVQSLLVKVIDDNFIFCRSPNGTVVYPDNSRLEIDDKFYYKMKKKKNIYVPEYSAMMYSINKKNLYIADNFKIKDIVKFKIKKGGK